MDGFVSGVNGLEVSFIPGGTSMSNTDYGVEE